MAFTVCFLIKVVKLHIVEVNGLGTSQGRGEWNLCPERQKYTAVRKAYPFSSTILHLFVTVGIVDTVFLLVEHSIVQSIFEGFSRRNTFRTCLVVFEGWYGCSKGLCLPFLLVWGNGNKVHSGLGAAGPHQASAWR